MQPSNRHSRAEASALLAWRALLKEAQHRPWLAAMLARRGAQIFSRFISFYRQLQALPRKLRRALRHSLHRTLAPTLLGTALLLALQPVPRAQAATITVAGACTLHDAITAANTDNPAGGCNGGSGLDTIELETDVILSGALPAITSDIVLNGNGHTVDGNNSVRAFTIAGGNLELNVINITNGYMAQDSGGAILNDRGDVTINYSTISGSAVGDGYLGGGIGNRGVSYETYATMTINNSTISGNSAGYSGGGIYAHATNLTINNSTITGNSATYDGGGLYSVYSSVTLNRTIISGNSSDHPDGDRHEVFNSLYGSTITADNFNVIGYDGYARSFNLSLGASDVVPAGLLNTLLEPTLADNGGPTLTHALVADSPALDLAPDADCFTSPIFGIDQRGEDRNADGDGLGSTGNECDAGAFELQEAPTAVQLSALQAQSAQGGLVALWAGLLLALGSAGVWLRRLKHA